MTEKKKKQYILTIIANGLDTVTKDIKGNKIRDNHDDGYPAILFSDIMGNIKIDDYEDILSLIVDDGNIVLENRGQFYGRYYHLTDKGRRFYKNGGYNKLTRQEKVQLISDLVCIGVNAYKAYLGIYLGWMICQWL